MYNKTVGFQLSREMVKNVIVNKQSPCISCRGGANHIVYIVHEIFFKQKRSEESLDSILGIYAKAFSSIMVLLVKRPHEDMIIQGSEKVL